MTRRRVLVSVALAAAVCGSLVAVTPSSGSLSRAAGLNAVVLKGPQVGPGYRLKMRPDSHCVQLCVTLDLCGFHFKSEAARTDRLQVDYLKNASSPPLSNEVVTYRPGGTALAMRELKRAVATCPRYPVKSTVAGAGKLTYRIHPFTASRLLPGAVALRMKISGKSHGHRVTITTFAIYQVHGRTLSGVYGFVTPGTTTAAVQRFAVRAARASARNLKRG